jgi:hypothetical protein
VEIILGSVSHSSTVLSHIFRKLTELVGVPELANVEGKAIFAPHERLSKEEFEKLGYPKPHVNWKQTKQRCMERFKRDMHDAEP